MSERQEQSAFFARLRYYSGQFSELNFIHASMNGAWMRSKKMAVIALGEGLLPGVWDVYVPIPSKSMNGLYIEFKYGKNKLTDTQENYGRHIYAMGYGLGVAFTADEGMMILSRYLEEPVIYPEIYDRL